MMPVLDMSLIESSPVDRQQPSSLSLDQVSTPTSERVILVAVGWGEASSAALRQANLFARAMGFKLRLVHAVPDPGSTDSLFWEASPPQMMERPAWLAWITMAMQTWASRQVGVQLPQGAVRAHYGEPTSIVLREAAESDVAMVVVGAKTAAPELGRDLIVQELVKRSPQTLLIITG